ncbi:uncharacterized protein RAG0_15963 [Rhynchosporium agropyri]|uniref:Uncharacterized protein n=1 Tax=Rhynchosporium agropyri TaxID=914238 RepID=A0A1E1LQ28_9HELO|nr:uncharacterized protein RAG0_15963 [Rhynchosporium agropyri]
MNAKSLMESSLQAFRIGTTTYNNVKSYRLHQQTLMEILEEIVALHSVLDSSKKLSSSAALDLSGLEYPRRYGQTLKLATLRYMGENIDGFLQLLAIALYVRILDCLQAGFAA